MQPAEEDVAAPPLSARSVNTVTIRKDDRRVDYYSIL